MALNLAIHKATITDDGGTIMASQANINGIHDEDQSTNVLEVAAENTCYLHYDLGAAYQISQIKIWASAVNTAYWVVQVSANDSDWTTESIASGGTYIYSNVDDGYRYLRIRCDTTGLAAVTLREFEILADATLMKYQAGSSDQIGSTIDAGNDAFTTGSQDIRIDNEHPAPSNGYLTGVKGFRWIKGSWTVRIYILRDLGTTWQVVDRSNLISRPSTGWYSYVIEPALKFKSGDILAVQGIWSSSSTVAREVSSAGDSYKWIATGDKNIGDLITKTDCTTRSDYELRLYSYSHANVGYGSSHIPVPDRDLTGLPGDSTDPRVVNIDTEEGLNPEIDFYSVISSLASGINDSAISLTLHKASDFPQAAAGATYGGRLQIGSEKIDYTYITGAVVYGLGRGADGTTPATHFAWDIVKDITKWIEISVDDTTFKKPGDAGLPLSLGATIAAGTSKTFYVRANTVYEYQDDKQIYSRIHALWSV